MLAKSVMSVGREYKSHMDWCFPYANGYRRMIWYSRILPRVFRRIKLGDWKAIVCYKTYISCPALCKRHTVADLPAPALCNFA